MCLPLELAIVNNDRYIFVLMNVINCFNKTNQESLACMVSRDMGI